MRGSERQGVTIMARSTILDLSVSRRHAASLFAGSALLGIAATSAQGAAQSSNTGEASVQVWGEGSDLVPSVPVAWRVIRQTAKPAGEAEFFNRTVGFIYNVEGETIEVTNQTQGTWEVLTDSAGEASVAFNREQDAQRRASTTALDVAYLNFDLIVADAVEDPETVGTGELLAWTDEPFELPGEEKVIQFVHVLAEGGQQVTVVESDPSAGAKPAMLMCLSGLFDQQFEEDPEGGYAGIMPGSFVSLSSLQNLYGLAGSDDVNELVGVTFPDLHDIVVA